MNNLKQHDSFAQLLKFGIVGISNTVIFFAVYYLFVWINKDWYMVGNIVAWIVSIANAYFWSNRYVFKKDSSDKSLAAKRIIKTYICYGLTFLVSSMLLYLEVDVWHLSVILSPIFNLLVTIPGNFLLNKYWAFAK